MFVYSDLSEVSDTNALVIVTNRGHKAHDLLTSQINIYWSEYIAPEYIVLFTSIAA